VALDEVSFDLREGECHALVGENGSGKSTLGRILAGSLRPDRGEIFIDGKAVVLSSPAAALERGIVAITQELTLAPALSVTENVLMGRLPRRRSWIMWSEAHRAARRALDELGVQVDVRVRVGQLSIALQQEVEIARALSMSARVVILDEATSSLPEQATRRLLERVEELRAQGVAILFVSHRLREVYETAQLATVLRDGRVVATLSLPATTERELIGRMVGREISDLYKKRLRSGGRPVLEVEELSTLDGAVKGVSLSVAQGEIVGVAGLVGSGKSELGLALAGAVPATGIIRVEGRTIALRSPRNANDGGVIFVPEDRKRSALFPTRTTGHNLSVSWSSLITSRGLVRSRHERRLISQTMRRFAIRAAGPHQPVVQLSGGNQQKVVLGRWFARKPRVLILSEPTRGVDVGARSEIYSLIQDMAAEGAAVLLISSEMPELLGLSDRIVVVWEGRLVGEFPAKSATEEEIAALAFGSAYESRGP
jgi:ABC-type sugar transport system ATPase subunit